MAVKVKTDRGGYFASLSHERVLVELDKDGDSPNCPNSWTWGLWFDGTLIESTCDETSLAESVKSLIVSLDDVTAELSEMSEWLKRYEVFGAEPKGGDS